MLPKQTPADKFLEQAYTRLEFESGDGWYLLSNTETMPNLTQTSWLVQAQRLGAEAIFFVRDYPTVLFFKLDQDISSETGHIEESIRQLHVDVWNTSRTPIFFVALPGELRVYSAYQKPVQTLGEWQSGQRWLKRVQNITKVIELHEFTRSSIESGHLFYQRRGDFDRDNRVDQWLLKNLRLLRKRLEGSKKEKREYIHALIGRSIFIRYLEDREILVEGYFSDEAISKQNIYRRYTDVLNNKEDTYNLFRKLSKDFNGDLFPLSDVEEQTIQEADLWLLRDFLLGRSMEGQPDLLFWAYKFNIIPTELISSIYEEFYHTNEDDNKGTHYTPTTLVDFVLSQCLTPEKIDTGVRILDPACGSGIFLVEAFKRIVHYECRRQGIESYELSKDKLTSLLVNQIVGIDVDRSAIQIAAFSLYLAFLDFRKPRDIRQHKQLPKLVYNPAKKESGNNLFCTNTFYPTLEEKSEIQKKIQGNKKRYAGKAKDERMLNQPNLPLKNSQFDLIIGNPPWGFSSSKENNLAIQWCDTFGYPIGHKEISQCFIWRVQRMLKQSGEVGLLITSSSLLKTREGGREFRQHWLAQNRIRAVYNFAHVRHIFFRKQQKDAISPFVAVFYTPSKPDEALQNKLFYTAIKRSALVEQLQAVIIDKSDMHKARQADFQSKDWLWKTYMWGNSSDAELMGELVSCYPPLEHFVTEYGYGYQVRNHARNKSKNEFNTDLELPWTSFYENMPIEDLLVPIQNDNITSLGNFNIYEGPRLLIKRGVPRSGNRLGEIRARLADTPFVYTDDLAGFRIDNFNENQRVVLLGIILSSLAKYYHFLSCSMWGLWHYKIHLSEHLTLPIHLPDDEELTHRIINAVKKVCVGGQTQPSPIFKKSNWREAQEELDEAIFTLYELSEPQKDLVRDLCNVTLDFFYKGTKSLAIRPPSVETLETYVKAFLEIWEERLALKGMELEARIFVPHNGLLCGVSFELKSLGLARTYYPITNDAEWQVWFRRMSSILRKKYSSGIYIDTSVKELELDGSSIFLIKRAEKRLWTKSQARQDAQELLMKVFELEWMSNRSKVA